MAGAGAGVDEGGKGARRPGSDSAGSMGVSSVGCAFCTVVIAFDNG